MASQAEKSVFISRIWEAVQAQPNLYGLFPSVIIAQAALESGWGSSVLSSQYNNYFGVKASPTQYSDAWNPQTSRTVNLQTQEYDNGYNSQVATWRVYASPSDSLKDRNALVSTNPRYAGALVASTPQQQVEAMKAGGYATDPNYVSKIMATIQSNNLTAYDDLYKRTNRWQSSVIAERQYGGRTTGKSKHPLLVVGIVALLLIIVAVILVKTKKIKLTK